MKAKLIILLSISCLTLSAQQLETYSGEFYNGTVDKGTAKYTYYLKNGEKVKHGSFVYSQELTTDEGYAKTKITGSFKDGFKNDTWTFIVEYKDFNTGAGNIWATGTTKMTANYSNGIPDGAWYFNRNSKTRSKNFTAYGYDWSTYNSPINESVQANYSQGILTGNFQMTNVIMNDFKNIKGQLDQNGFCIGDWSFESDRKEMAMKFYKNVETDFVVRDRNSGKVEEKSDYSIEQLSALKHFADGSGDAKSIATNHRIKIDTANWIESRLINIQSTFYSNLFLEKYIGGDKTYSEENREFYKIERGLYRIFGNTKGMEIIDLMDISEYRGAIRKIETYPKAAISELEYLKERYAFNLSDSDMQTLIAKLKLAKEKQGAKEQGVAYEKLSLETKSNLKSDLSALSAELRTLSNSSKKSIQDSYYSKLTEIKGIKSDYAKSRDLQNELSSNVGFALNLTTKEIDRLKKEAGISDGMSLGYSSTNTASVPLEKLKGLQSELSKISPISKELVQSWGDLYDSHYNIMTKYNVYDKLKSSATGIATYKVVQKSIYDNYLKIFDSEIKSLKSLSSIEDLKNGTKRLLTLTSKVMSLSGTNTKTIEKELKKVSGISEARNLIMR